MVGAAASDLGARGGAPRPVQTDGQSPQSDSAEARAGRAQEKQSLVCKLGCPGPPGSRVQGSRAPEPAGLPGTDGWLVDGRVDARGTQGADLRL